MKQTTIFAICTIVSLIWVLATCYAVIYNKLTLITPIEFFICVTPFIVCGCCWALYNIESNKEI